MTTLDLTSHGGQMTLARRSSLILPVNQPRFVERAYTRGADAIVLDLEDSVPVAEKANARKLVKDAFAFAARGGAEVAVRVNNEPGLLDEDVDAAVHPGLDNLNIPKAESADQIRELAARVDRLERARGLAPGHVQFSLAVETPVGLLATRELATASPRIRNMSVGVEDYCLSLGVEPSADGTELLYAVSFLVTICKAVGVEPTGLVGSIAGFRDLATSAPPRAAIANASFNSVRAFPFSAAGTESSRSSTIASALRVYARSTNRGWFTGKISDERRAKVI